MTIKETVGKFNLITGEETYSGANAQNPSTSRRLKSLIPSRDGQLTRELGEAQYLPTNLGSSVTALFQYDYNDASGVKQSKFFAVAGNSLYQNTGAAWAIVTLPTSTGVTSTSAIVQAPQFVVINNLLHMGDGVSNWIYDGLNNAWMIEGFGIPVLSPPGIDTATAGTFTCVIGRYYWYTFADETSGRAHEGSSSAISVSTGALTNKLVKVSPTTGTVNTTSGSAAVVGIGTAFDLTMVGKKLYVNGVDFGAILLVTDTTHLTLVTNAPSTVAGGSILIAQARATHIHIYASETDGSKLGQYLGKLAVTANPPIFSDQSPFINQANSSFLQIDRPIRNDSPPPSTILEVHKYRIFRRRETKPNFFTYSANEEVSSGNGNGSPQESVPGTDVNTLSDIINETSYPRQSNRIRALKSHADALYIATEKDIIPLYGESIDDFGLSQVTAISNGVISRWGMESTSHGLSIFSYDRKVLLYPQISPIYPITPKEINVTDQLMEIGLPMRKKFLTIKSSDQDNVRTLWYNFNSRNWLVVCYQDNTNVYHTYVYDFETKGWFELQRGFVSIAIFEPTAGNKILVGGGTDGIVYVIDDLTVAITPNATLPSALWRTALIDFGKPDMLHVPDYLEFEATSDTLAASISVNFYLDPLDADNPGTPYTLSMAPVPNSANLYRGYFSAAGNGMGVLCKRLMVEFNVPSNAFSGAIRGVVLKSDPVPNLLR